MGSLVLSFLLSALVFVHDFLVGGLLGSGSFLALLDFPHSFLSQSFLFLRAGILEFFDVVEGHTFNSSLLSEDFSPFAFSLISLL